MLVIKNLVQWPDEQLSLNSYLDHLARSLAIRTEQFRAIVEDLASRRAKGTDDLPQLIREEAAGLAALLRTRKVFELAARAQGLIP